MREEAVTEVARLSFIESLSAADVAQAQGAGGRFIGGKIGRVVARSIRGGEDGSSARVATLRAVAPEPGRSGATPDAGTRSGVDLELVEQRVHPAHALGDL